MSKSLGNVLLVRDLLHKVPGEAIRLALLSTHYRRPLDWNAQRLASARQTLMHCYTALDKVDALPPTPGVAPDEGLLAALRNDLNVPAALVRLRELVSALNKAETEAAQSRAKASLLAPAGLLGLLRRDPKAALAALNQRTPVQQESALPKSRIEALVAEREQAREQRCRFYPSCSHYAIEAVELHGPFKVGWLALRRLLRCHPLHPGGVDLVPPAKNDRTAE